MRNTSGTVCIFFRVYNDTDHLSPVAWRFLREGRQVDVILIDKNQVLDYRRDPRLVLLRQFSRCRMYYYYGSAPGLGFLREFSLARFVNPLVKIIIRTVLSFLDQSVFNLRWAEKFIESRRPAVCIFDPFGPGEISMETLEGKLVTACKDRRVPLVCLPHGAHFLTSHGEGSEQFQATGGEEYFAVRNIFDAIVEPNPRHHFGPWDKKLIEQKKIVFLGSARYCPEWFSIAKNFWPDFKPSKSEGGRLKLLFFLPRWEKTVDKEGVLLALKSLASDDRIYLVIKEHTREGAGDLPMDLRTRLSSQANVELINASRAVSFKRWLSSLVPGKKATRQEIVDSVALIRWCDAAVNVRSSIGFEVILQGKTLINPTYLHRGRTIFEDSGAGIECHDLEQLLAGVERARLKEPPSALYDNADLIRNSIYAGGEPVDVLSTYTKLVSSLQRE